MPRPKSTIPKYKRKRPQSLFKLLWKWLIRLILVFLIGSILWVLAYRFINPPITFTMLGDVFAGRGATREWMPITQIDRDMVRAAIAAEDSKFCSHHGFDYQAIENAMQRNASGGRIRGGSTISQQTAKNAFLWQNGGYVRKGMEAWFTFLIENLWGKRRIMEVYLNLDETGVGTYGVNAGSQRYFGHDASAMTATEAARLAAVFPLPKKRGAVAPQGFTRRYGNIIAARIGVVGRDGLDACIYKGAVAPVKKAPPVVTRKPRPVPGEEFESTKPLPPVDISEPEQPAATEPSQPDQQSSPPPPPADQPTEPGNAT
jgi:monofunctional biosynthetic peptidoglycan transglycosylase